MVLSFSAALPLALHVPYMLKDGPIYPPSPCSHNDERTSNCDSIALAAIAVMQAVS